MESRFFPIDDHTPYTDRKLARNDDAPLDVETIVAIQRMACEGKRPHDIYTAFADQGVTMDQVMTLIDPPAERADAARSRRPQRANVGFAGFKGRR
jgi:hypothetical protein